jgi:fatty-acyl-CoA synthase
VSGHVLAALDAARTGGVELALGGREGRTLSWAALKDGAARVAAGLRAAGLERGDRLLLVLPTSEDALLALFGCWLAGVVPCNVSPPAGVGSEATFRQLIGRIAERVKARGVVVQEGLAPLVSDASPLVLLASALREATGRAPDVAVDLDATAYVQLTSGTTHLQKAALISHRAIAANARQVGAWLGLGPSALTVTWLPLFHDMGLFGGLLTPLFHDASVRLSRPMDFLRRPASWLQAIASHPGEVMSPAPAFAYGYVTKQARDADLAGLDLSRWTTSFAGAEPIHAGILRAFEERLAPCGLPATTLRPSYGLAECTLAVTATRTDARWSALPVSRARLAGQGVVAPPAGDVDTSMIVSCGLPLDGTRVRIIHDSGREAVEGTLGEVQVASPSMFQGYLDDPEATAACRDGEWLKTGDLGFLREGELYVTGRKKDIIILRGHNHHPEEVEWVAAQVPGVRAGRVVAFGVSDAERGTERLCLLVEHDPRAGVEPAAFEQELRRRVADESGLHIDGLLLVERGAIESTTSGKVRRAHARQLFLERTKK